MNYPDQIYYPRIKPKNLEKTQSKPPKTAAITRITPITIQVNRIASRRVGQETFFNSPIVSWKNFWVLCPKRWKKFICWREVLKSGTIILQSWLKRRLFQTASSRCYHSFSFQAGQAGIEPTTPAFGERCSAKLSYWPVWELVSTNSYLVSRCSVCLRQRGQYLFNSIRPGSLRRFFSVV